jgi:FkbM family methyltransferase
MNIKRFIPAPLLFLIRIALHLSGRYSRECYSQEGEDILLARFRNAYEPGFYVDVGAHHPSIFSNTFFFYKRGWRGINIDATPGSMRVFNIVRPRDINLEIAVSDKQEILEFHTFSNPLLNSADRDIVKSRRTALNEQSASNNVFRVNADTLESILDKHLPPGTEIDFMSVDVEGADLKVLLSNDWTRFRPKYLFVEILGATIETLHESQITKYLTSVGYEPMSKLLHTVLFKEKSIGDIGYI